MEKALKLGLYTDNQLSKLADWANGEGERYLAFVFESELQRRWREWLGYNKPQPEEVSYYNDDLGFEVVVSEG